MCNIEGDPLEEYVYVATVGKTSEKVLVGLRSRPNIAKVGLIGTGDPDVVKCMGDIEQFAERLGYKVEKAFVDPFNIFDVVAKTKEMIEKHRGKRIVVNVSGGTRVMTIGALIASHFDNTEIVYVPSRISEKSPTYIDLPPIHQLTEKTSLPSKVLTSDEDIVNEILKRAKDEYPTISTVAVQNVLNSLLKNQYEFEAWDTRYIRYPRLVKIYEKTENKVIEETIGPFDASSGFLAKCTNCKSWFGFPLKIGAGYFELALSINQGLEPPQPSKPPPPLGSAEYANLMLKSQNEFYCQKCAVLFGLNNIITKMKRTAMII
jgi:hypothetical protein